MKQFIRIISMLLIIAMVVSVLPMQEVFALTDEGVETASASSTLTLSLSDSYGDGWSGNELALYINDEFFRSYAVSSRSSTYTLDYDSASQYVFKWIKGNYPDECSFTISLDGTAIFTASKSACSSYTTNQVVFTYGRVAETVAEGSCGTNVSWILYDTDYTFGNVGSNRLAINLATGDLGSADATCQTLAVRLMKNSEFRDKFLSRLAWQMNNLWTEENVIGRSDEIQSLIIGDMEKECRRWNQTYDHWIKSVEHMRDFARNRNGIMLTQIRNYFYLTDAEMRAYGFQV